MTMDLTVKNNVVRYLDTIVAEAGKHLGHENVDAQVDSNIRPAGTHNYNPNQFLATAKKTLEITEEYHAKALLLTNHQNPIDPLSIQIFDLIGEVKKIDQIQVNKHRHFFYSGCMGLAGLGLLGIGYLVPAQWMKTVGKVVLAFTGIILVSSWFWYRGTTEQVRNSYEIIRRLGEAIRNDLVFFDDNMNRQLNNDN